METPAPSDAGPRRTPALPADWLGRLGGEFEKDYMVRLRAFLSGELARGRSLHPHGREIFAAFGLTPLASVRVVILGQDPYHGPGQAHGLSFSVRRGVPVPPSLANIHRELRDDLGHPPPPHGNLEGWARQGVLLLNAVLTVERGRAASHRDRGWETFTDRVVDVLDREGQNLVFLLWGSHAQRKGAGIDAKRHLVLRAPHPSPLSAHRGFLGCRHFSRANRHLESVGKGQVDWSAFG